LYWIILVLESEGNMGWRSLKYLSVVLLLGILSITVARAETAEEMASNCREIVLAKVSNEGDKGTALAVPNNLPSGICWGAFLSFQSAIMVVGNEYPDGTHSPTPRPFFAACAADASTSQLIKIFVHYIDEHPERLNQDFFFVAVLATQKAFPCKSAH
jgi:hypothetical protein